MITADFIKHSDLKPLTNGDEDFTEAVSAILIADTLAEAERLAPDLFTDKFPESKHHLAMPHIRKAILRNWETGNAGLTQFTAGSYSGTFSTGGKDSSAIFTRLEVDALQGLTKPRKGKAFVIDTTPKDAFQ